MIDLKLLEAVGDSAGAEELRASLADQERVHARELGDWKRAIDRATDVLAGEGSESVDCCRGATQGDSTPLIEPGLD